MTDTEGSANVTEEEAVGLMDTDEDNAETDTYSKINAGNLVGADKMYEKGYNGEGRAVAVIDSEVDYNNDYFALTEPSKAKYTKSDIERIITEKGVNAGTDNKLEANQAYRSAKISFAYNYDGKNSVVNCTLVHGSHVSGIVVGNSAYVNDGTTNSGKVSGIAPEAQLLFFRVANDKGEIDESAIIAAIDDAVTFEVDAANISRSIYPSYGYSDNLDIAIDFSAPGGNIYSSVPYNKMENNSGTSMAAPQVTGAMSLMYAFIEDKYPSYTGADKVQLIQNLLASTADTIYEENGAVSSPRAVGSGIINLENATATNVILTANNTEDNRINLGEKPGSEFTVSFTVENIGDTAFTFDSAKAEL
ncbi:MAG: S8 family serine peptidase [Hominilimicola sp.]